jgi:subtilisin family serine protease
MKVSLLATLFFIGGASLMAQAQLDLTSQAVLRQIKLERAGASHSAPSSKAKVAKQEANAGQVVVLLRVGAGMNAASVLASENVEVLSQRGDIAIVAMNIDDVERVAALPVVKQLQLSRELRPMLDKAREASGVDKIHNGTDLTQAYTGKGVVTGIVDSGIDPNHINFMGTDGKSRIQQLTYVRANAAGTDALTTYYTNQEDDINNLRYFTTDSRESYHGSHTMGIMAGGYRGELEYATLEDDHQSPTYKDKNPFYGVAYESDIVASCGTLGDGYIAYGVEYILDWAYNHNKPAVINLSLGSNTGGHDGNDMLNQYLALAGEEGIICVSAGNEGDMPIAINKTFTATDNEVKTFVYPWTYGKDAYKDSEYYKVNYGAMYVYSNDETPLDVQLVIYNRSRNRVAQRFVVPKTGSGSATYYVSSSDYAQSSDDVTSAQLGQYFDGYVGLGSSFDDYSGRYYALLDIYLQPNGTNFDTDQYVVGIQVTGTDGQRVDIYSDALASTFTSYGIDGWTDGSQNGSISSMACGDNVVVVGSYNTRDSWGCLDGVERGYDDYYLPGTISNYSSYGTLIDGRNLPHICAPGASIVSSTNNYYISYYADQLTEGSLQARYTGTDRNSYWQTAAGTSMSSPFVAGSLALWLEADPTLTYNDVIDIITKTANVDSEVTKGDVDPVQWGAGKFDAYAGLKEVINRSSGVANITADQTNRLMVKDMGGNIFNVFLGGEALNINVYSTNGTLVKSVKSADNDVNLDLSSLSSGIYVLNVNNHLSTRIIVK